MDLISVIIPVYKVEKYLRRCVDSVLAQTYTNLEIILVDDGSPDLCGEICDEYAAKDPRVKVVHQENGGISRARNAGLDLAVGEYFAFLDSDDYVDEGMYEKLHQVALEYEADVVECGHRWIRPNRVIGKVLDEQDTGQVDVYTNVEALEKLYFGSGMFGGLTIMVWNKLYKSSVYRSMRFPEGLLYEDSLYTPKVFYMANKIVKLNRNMYNFYMAEGSLTRSGYNLTRLDAISVKKQCMEFFAEQGLQRYYDLSESDLLNALFGNYYECRSRGKDPAYRSHTAMLKKEIKRYLPQAKRNSFVQNSAWRNRLFGVSPTLWYAATWVVRKKRHYQWLIKHKKRLHDEKRLLAMQTVSGENK